MYVHLLNNKEVIKVHSIGVQICSVYKVLFQVENGYQMFDFI